MRSLLFLAMTVVSVAGCSNEPVASPPATNDDVSFEIEFNALHSAALNAKLQCSLALARTSPDNNGSYARVLITCGRHAERLFKWADFKATPINVNGVRNNPNHSRLYGTLAEIVKLRSEMYKKALACVWPLETAAKDTNACINGVDEEYKDFGGLY